MNHGMRFNQTPIGDAYLIEPEERLDERGSFGRTWCADELREAGLDTSLAQCSFSFNALASTVRGLHYQIGRHAESKIVRCTAGAVFDVVVDLRRASSTFAQSFGVELTSHNHVSLYIPKGCAHGFQTLSDDSEILYMMSTAFEPKAARVVRWNDPTLAVAWPQPTAAAISARDAEAPLLADLAEFDFPCT
jgi:dTDP-4-dehydrorhamnose 3,5-epimerase